jgi:hypothetical protein
LDFHIEGGKSILKHNEMLAIAAFSGLAHTFHWLYSHMLLVQLHSYPPELLF